MQNINNKENSWQHIFQDAGSQFDTAAIDDPILQDCDKKGLYLSLEKYDTLLTRLAIIEELALSFFLSGLTIELEKSIRVNRLTSVQEAI